MNDLHTINPGILLMGAAANSASVRAVSTLRGVITLDSLKRARRATKEACKALRELDRAIKSEIAAAEKAA